MLFKCSGFFLVRCSGVGLGRRDWGRDYSLILGSEVVCVCVCRDEWDDCVLLKLGFILEVKIVRFHGVAIWWVVGGYVIDMMMPLPPTAAVY